MKYLFLFLVLGCSKLDVVDLPECECYKYTKIAYDIHQIDRVECQDSSEGLDENGYKFNIACK